MYFNVYVMTTPPPVPRPKPGEKKKTLSFLVALAHVTQHRVAGL